MTIARLLTGGAALAAAVCADHRLALRRERKGWIYCRNALGSGSTGNALSNVQTFSTNRRRATEWKSASFNSDMSTIQALRLFDLNDN